MPLPPAAPRRQLHTRRITFRGFQREDGDWDIEGDLLDTRTYTSQALEKGSMAPETPIHDIRVRVTVNDALEVKDIAAQMSSVPFVACQPALAPLRGLIGATLGPGWRRSIDTHLGGTASCAHLRELLFNVATAAYQTVPVYLAQVAGQSAPTSKLTPPLHMGKCTTWAFDGPLIRDHYPQFINWVDPRRTKA